MELSLLRYPITLNHMIMIYRYLLKSRYKARKTYLAVSLNDEVP